MKNIALITLFILFAICSKVQSSEQTKEIKTENNNMQLDVDSIVNLVITMEIDPSYKNEIKQIFATMVNETRKEKGCIIYDLYEDEKDSNSLVLIEKWATQTDLNNHSNSPHFKAYKEATKGKFISSKAKRIKSIF